MALTAIHVPHSPDSGLGSGGGKHRWRGCQLGPANSSKAHAPAPPHTLQLKTVSPYAIQLRYVLVVDSLTEVPRKQKMLKGNLPAVIYHQVYLYTKKAFVLVQPEARTARAPSPPPPINPGVPDSPDGFGERLELMGSEAAGSRRARTAGAWICVSLNSRLERSK